MTDLERAIKAELNRQSATAPSSASTEQFALSLIGPPDLSAATSRRHPVGGRSEIGCCRRSRSPFSAFRSSPSP
jgi:hypothetical protein